MLRLGIVGTGGMARGHCKNFQAIKGCQVAACCDILPGRAKEFAAAFNIPAAYEDAEEMLRKERLDGLSVVTIDRAHAPVALLAIKHGVPVLCEKPLADTLANARKMVAAARSKKLLTAVNFTYRNNPATQKAAELVAAGKLGRILHVEGSYLQDWLVTMRWGDWRTNDAMAWRLSTRHGSAGVLGDIGVHLYDLASFVVGDFAEVACTLKTFEKELRGKGPYIFDANDSCLSTVRFKNGALGTLHTTRWATGHANTVALRVHGEKGALDLNLDRPAPETLRLCAGKDLAKAVWRGVKCAKTPNMYQRFVTALKTGQPAQTSFAGGLKIQACLDASFASAAKGGVFTKVKID